MSKLLSAVFAAVAAFAAVATSTPLFAAEPALVYKTATVAYRDLNLASTDGQKMLHTRVRAAVRDVCAIEKSPALNEHRVVQGCRRTAFESARPQVDRVLAAHRPQVIIAASR